MTRKKHQLSKFITLPSLYAGNIAQTALAEGLEGHVYLGSVVASRCKALFQDVESKPNIFMAAFCNEEVTNLYNTVCNNICSDAAEQVAEICENLCGESFGIIPNLLAFGK